MKLRNLKIFSISPVLLMFFGCSSPRTGSQWLERIQTDNHILWSEGMKALYAQKPETKSCEASSPSPESSLGAKGKTKSASVRWEYRVEILAKRLGNGELKDWTTRSVQIQPIDSKECRGVIDAEITSEDGRSKDRFVLSSHPGMNPGEEDSRRMTACFQSDRTTLKPGTQIDGSIRIEYFVTKGREIQEARIAKSNLQNAELQKCLFDQFVEQNKSRQVSDRFVGQKITSTLNVSGKIGGNVTIDTNTDTRD